MIRSVMDRATAERLISAVLALDTLLGELDNAVSKITDEHERKAFVRALGDIFRLLNEDFIIPIGQTYPHLAPED